MSALSVLYLVLPLPLAFIMHEAEQIALQPQWLRRHGQEMSERFPRLCPWLWRRHGRRALCIAAVAELLLVLFVTAYVLVQGPCAAWLWSAMFLAFAGHQMVHLTAGILVRGYVPGLGTSILLLPYSGMGLLSVVQFIIHSS